MKIAYIAHIRLPTEKAHGIQIMKTCEALAELGYEITLFVLKTSGKDPFMFYGVKENFKIEFISVPYLLWLKSFGFFLQSFIFSEFCAWRMFHLKPNLVYSRDELVILNFILVFKNIIWEVHRFTNSFVSKLILKKVHLVVISQGLFKAYGKLMSSRKKICVAHDAVDLGQFKVSLSKEQCRKKLGLPEAFIVMYAGHLYKRKGADILAIANRSFKSGQYAVFVGGTTPDVERFKKDYGDNQQMMILGQRPYEEIPMFLASADVLVLPNSAKDENSRLHTSPMKLFEYMASGTPIISSDVPSAREILSDKSALFFEPDNPESLSNEIQYLVNNKQRAQELAKGAYEVVKNMDWHHRALTIESLIKDIMKS